MDSVWTIIFFMIAFGIVLPLVLARTSILKKAAHKLPKSPSGLKLMRCDCGANTQCPQGRDALGGGNPYRCQIWKAE